MKAREARNLTILYLVTAAISFVCLFPVLYSILASFKPNREMYLYPPAVFPHLWSLEAYVDILSQSEYIRHFLNTWIIALSTTAICVVLSSLAGYGFSRFRLPGKRALLFGILAMQMFPGTVLMIPYFRLTSAFRLYDTYLALVLINCAFVLPLAIWLLKSFFDSIPYELEESAMIEGCTSTQAIIHITVPLSRAGVLAIAIMSFLKTWNEFLFALILTKGPERAPISVGLANLFTTYDVKLNTVMAITVISIFPLLLILIFLQRNIVAGITGGAIK